MQNTHTHTHTHPHALTLTHTRCATSALPDKHTLHDATEGEDECRAFNKSSKQKKQTNSTRHTTTTLTMEHVVDISDDVDLVTPDIKRAHGDCRGPAIKRSIQIPQRKFAHQQPDAPRHAAVYVAKHNKNSKIKIITRDFECVNVLSKSI